jgi:hypothetical protein
MLEEVDRISRRKRVHNFLAIVIAVRIIFRIESKGTARNTFMIIQNCVVGTLNADIVVLTCYTICSAVYRMADNYKSRGDEKEWKEQRSH